MNTHEIRDLLESALWAYTKRTCHSRIREALKLLDDDDGDELGRLRAREKELELEAMEEQMRYYAEELGDANNEIERLRARVQELEKEVEHWKNKFESERTRWRTKWMWRR